MKGMISDLNDVLEQAGGEVEEGSRYQFVLLPTRCIIGKIMGCFQERGTDFSKPPPRSIPFCGYSPPIQNKLTTLSKQMYVQKG